MDTSTGFFDTPAGTREEIMRATYLALCDHGYADLTIQRIADEFPKSKSLIYHHYDGKDDLLLDFLEFMVERFEDQVPFDGTDGPADHLEAVLDHVLQTPLPEHRQEFAKAMVELRAQAAHDDRYRDHFTRSDRFFRDRLATIIDAGVTAGEFRAVDPEATATFLLTVLNGAMADRVTNADESTEAVRTQIDAYLSAVVRATDDR